MDLVTVGLSIDGEGTVQTIRDFGNAAEKAGLQVGGLEDKVKATTPSLTAAEKATNAAARATAQHDTALRQMGLTQLRAMEMDRARTASLLAQAEATSAAGVATVGATNKMSVWNAMQAEAAGHVGHHSLALGRLELMLSRFVEHLAGISPVLGMLASSLGKFALGSIEITAVLLGIAAVAAIIHSLTEASRETEKAATAAIKVLTQYEKVNTLGPGGEYVDAASKVRAVRSLHETQLDDAVNKRSKLTPGEEGYFAALAGLDSRISSLRTKILQDDANLTVAQKAYSEERVKAAHAEGDAWTSDLARMIANHTATRYQIDLGAAQLASNRAKLADMRTRDQNDPRYGIRAQADVSSRITELDSALHPKAETRAEIALMKELIALTNEQGLAEADRQSKKNERSFNAGNDISVQLDEQELLLTAIRDSATAYREQKDEIEVINYLTEKGVLVTDADYKQKYANYLLVLKTKDAIADTIEANRKATEEATSAAKRAAEEAQRPMKEMLRQMQQDFASFFDSVLTKGVKSFSDLMSMIKDMFVKLIAELAAAAIMRRIMGTVGGLLGGLVAQTAGAQSTQTGNPGVDIRFGGSTPNSPGWFGRHAGQIGAGVGGALVGYGLGQSAGDAKNGALEGAAGGAATGFMVGGVPGAIIGGLAGLAGGLLGGAQAAREHAKALREAQAALKQSMASYTANVMHDELGAALAQARSSLQSLLLQINAALPGKVNETERNAERVQAQQLEKIQEAQLTAQIAAQQKARDADLGVRNLRAQGRNIEADRLAFANQQTTELAQAIATYGEGAYTAALRTTQAAEAIAFMNGVLQDTVRNAPAAFKVAQYQSEFAVPFTGGATDPFGVGGFTPPTPTPVPTSPIVFQFNDGSIAIDGDQSGAQLFTTFMTQLRQRALATVGANVPLSQALDVVS